MDRGPRIADRAPGTTAFSHRVVDSLGWSFVFDSKLHPGASYHEDQMSDKSEFERTVILELLEKNLVIIFFLVSRFFL